MFVRNTCLFLILSFVDSMVFHCGPDEQCLCTSEYQMDCSGTNIPISNVCRFISNSTNLNVSTLLLERNSYKSIRKLDFKACDRLYHLDLGENDIVSIEDGAFVSLSRLQFLNVSNNSLPVYNEDHDHTIIKFPLTIKTLMLNGNSNRNTSGHAYPDLSYLQNLSLLYMDGLWDKAFPVIYRKMETLQSVILSGFNGNCNMPWISNATFQSLLHVRKLNISACNIINISAGAFSSLSKLKTLDLSYNLRLGFRSLRNISYSLQFTNIKSLNLSKLHSTFSMGIKLTKRDVCYMWNTNLTEIVLNNNRIQLFETNVFLLLPKTLKKMHFEDNIFTFGLYLLQPACLVNLEEIYASYQNRFHSFMFYNKEPIESSYEVMIEDDDCPFMKDEFLKNISKTIKYCPFFENDNIQVVDHLPHFPKKLKRVEFVKCNMEYNISASPVFFPKWNSVKYMDFSGNILYSWIGPLGPFPELKYLNLSRNYCSHIGKDFFECCTTAENIQIQENFLGLVFSDEKYGSVVFDKLVNVKVLNLSSNIISYLPPNVFSKLIKLETLDLSVNSIEAWNIDVNALDNLLHLNLKSNSLRSLPITLTNKLESNSKRLDTKFTIDLRNNVFTTNCDDKEYLKWMVKNRANMLYFDENIFIDENGSSLSAQQFVEAVHKLDRECRSYSFIIVITTMCISVFLGVIVCGMIYRNRWKLRYLMRTAKLRRFGYDTLEGNLTRDETFAYDSFVSYANENIRFILDKIIPNLEAQDMKLCVHDRDFLPGNNIADNILGAIKQSRKTVVVLSKDFLQSQWCLYEFNMARMESIYSREGANCLLVVMLEDVPSRLMSNEMLEWIKSNTYIEYTTDEEGEVLFWENLKEALRE